ncbi:hypothetical protein LDENG_00080600 [Lucifuga dentata]|nr:hypothetical protein LDENG_00080600 [Lucifuga dentata]
MPSLNTFYVFQSFFGKRKDRYSGPPAPPRIDNNAGFEWPQDEFEIEHEEEGDMYEVPPCERPAVKVPPRQVKEEVYLDRTSSPPVTQRQAAPPPRAAKWQTSTGKPLPSQHAAEQFFVDSSSKKPPEIDRNEKPARKMMAPFPTRSVPVPSPAPTSNLEEDVYLDPNEEQNDNDDLYLEPTAVATAVAACPPVPHGPMRIPPSPKTAAVPSPIAMMKPPVPRAKSRSLLPSLNEVKTALSLDARRPMFATKLPPPTPGFKPPLPANLKEAIPSPSNPSLIDATAAASSSGMRTSKQPLTEDKEWFVRDCKRKTAEDLLLRVNKDGAFLIRHSSAQNAHQPYTLAVLYQKKVYNIPIRFLEETKGYALGKEGKKNEEIFSSLEEIISHHNHHQLLLIDSKSQAKHTTYLTHPVRP